MTKIEQPSAPSRGVLNLSTGSRLFYPSFSRRRESRLVDLQIQNINLDAGFRRHDELSLRLKARDFNHPREDINKIQNRIYLD